MFPQPVVSSSRPDAVACRRGGSGEKRDVMQPDKPLRRAGSVVGMAMDSLVTVKEMPCKTHLLPVIDNDSHPGKREVRSVAGDCSTERLRRSLFPERQ